MKASDLVAKYNKGQIFREEAVLIVSYALKALSISNIIVEIGTKKGKTTRLLGYAIKENAVDGKIITIDPHYDPVAVPKELINSGIVSFVKNTSFWAARHLDIIPGLVFVDGCHCEECTYKDISDWKPKIPIGGYMIFHDYTKDGQMMPEPPHRGRVHGVRAAVTKSDMSDCKRIDQAARGHTQVFKKIT